MLLYPDCMPCFLVFLGWGPRWWLAVLLQRDANLSLLRAAWAPGHGCSVRCAKCHPTTGQEGNPIVAGLEIMQVQWSPLGECLDIWRKQAIQYLSYLQASNLFQCVLGVPDCPWAFPGASSFTSSLKFCCTNVWRKEPCDIWILISLFFSSTLYFLCLCQADHPSQVWSKEETFSGPSQRI